jgi:dTDP-4-amino-4,6-dideoxygalactose transaminase
MLSEKLAHLDAWNARRRAIADRYLEGLAGLPLALPADAPGHAWHVFAVHTPERDALAAHLAGEGVGTLVHYPIPPHLQDAYRDLGMGEGDLPVAERLARETLSLPMGPHLAPEDADRVVAAVRGFLRADG